MLCQWAGRRYGVRRSNPCPSARKMYRCVLKSWRNRPWLIALRLSTFSPRRQEKTLSGSKSRWFFGPLSSLCWTCRCRKGTYKSRKSRINIISVRFPPPFSFHGKTKANVIKWCSFLCVRLYVVIIHLANYFFFRGTWSLTTIPPPSFLRQINRVVITHSGSKGFSVLSAFRIS